MNIIDSIALFAIMVTLAAIPSTSVALVITRSATLGLANGIAVATGIVIGDLIFVLLALLGLSVVSETSGDLFSGIKYLGGAYLIGMGIGLLRSRDWTTVTVEQRELGTLLTSLLAGLFLTLGDTRPSFSISVCFRYSSTLGHLARRIPGLLFLSPLPLLAASRRPMPSRQDDLLSCPGAWPMKRA